MAEHVRPPAGSIITYFDPEPGDGGPFHRGVAGGTISDPDTERTWTFVTPDDPDPGPAEQLPTALVDETLIVDLAPPARDARPPKSPPDPIAQLCAALETAIGQLDQLDEGAHHAWPTARRILVALLDTVTPAREALLDRLDDDPDSRVALTIDHLDSAVAHLDAGRVASGRAALRSAHRTLTAGPPSGRPGLATRPTRPGR